MNQTNLINTWNNHLHPFNLKADYKWYNFLQQKSFKQQMSISKNFGALTFSHYYDLKIQKINVTYYGSKLFKYLCVFSRSQFLHLLMALKYVHLSFNAKNFKTIFFIWKIREKKKSLKRTNINKIFLFIGIFKLFLRYISFHFY